MNYLFVYGTLKKGFYNHKLLGLNKELIGKRIITGFSLIQEEEQDYPIAIKHSSGFIQGELYMISDKAMEKIDKLETQFGYKKIMSMTTYNEQCYIYIGKIRKHPATRFSLFTKELKCK